LHEKEKKKRKYPPKKQPSFTHDRYDEVIRGHTKH
jgi:hypothetical protein